MRELVDQILGHARGIWRYRWYMMLVAWLVCLAGWALVYKLPDQYKATARVHVDTQSILRPLLHGLAVETNTSRRVELMTRTLLSRPNLEKLARMTDMDLKAKTPEQMEGLINSLRGHIDIESTRRENLYTISYENSDRQLAKRVVQSLLTIFVESTLGNTRADTDSAQQFLSQQIKDYEQKLEQAEERLAEFKRKNVGLMPGEGQDYYSRLQSANNDLQQAKLALEEARKRRDVIKQQFKHSEEAAKSTSQAQAQAQMSSPLDQRIDDIQKRIDDLRLKYTDKYPDVIELKRLKAELEARRKKQLAQAGNSDVPSTDPMAEQMQMAVTQADAQVASMKARVDEYQKRVDHLKKMVNTIPQVEAELKRLNRDYSVNKKNYQALLARRESAKISEQANLNTDDVKFQVVDPPHVPLAPSSPNRPLFLSVVLLGGLGAGIVFAFFLYQMRPTFTGMEMLKSVTGIPVLGTVSMIRTREYIRRRRLALASFGLACVALVAVYSVILTVQLLDLHILSSLSGLGSKVL